WLAAAVGHLFLFGQLTQQRAAHEGNVGLDVLRPEIGALSVSATNADGTVDVTVEVASMTEEVSIDANDRSKKKKLTSGVYDLRLSRDGQLVGTSTPRAAMENYIRNAPAAVEKDRKTLQ